jgi:hypothetical protein
MAAQQQTFRSSWTIHILEVQSSNHVSIISPSSRCQSPQGLSHETKYKHECTYSFIHTSVHLSFMGASKKSPCLSWLLQCLWEGTRVLHFPSLQNTKTAKLFLLHGLSASTRCLAQSSPDYILMNRKGCESSSGLF